MKNENKSSEKKPSEPLQQYNVSGSTVCLETADFYQEFFNFFSKEHNLILTIQEMDEIRHECRKLETRLGN